MRRRIYPANWKEIVAKVRARSRDQCECTGECGLHRTTPGPRRCEERHRQAAKWARGMVILTTAHLCQDSTCDKIDHLRHMCNRCHLRLDVGQHVLNAAETRRLLREYDERNQTTFDFPPPAPGVPHACTRAASASAVTLKRAFGTEWAGLI